MLAREDIERFRAANNELSKRVQDTLEAFVRSLNFKQPEMVRDALLEFMPALTAQYGSVAASIAAEWYQEQRTADGASGRFRPALAANVPADAVQSKVRYLASHLWTPTPEAIIGPLLTAADKYVKQPGRATTALNAKREGVAWARVPTGAKTCTWCLILASRDAVYVSERSAKTGKDGEHYHGDCDCQAVRIGSSRDYPPGYLPDDYYDMYQSARDEAGSNDVKDIAAAFRRLHPDAVNDGVHTH
ncbi:hypothetical protein SB659_10370 [Arthrobacter sp. SIMBA_036]|uniref:VG15 protein n=1 Tax=Arthrobacter sp. SIMBA_036 TaxID=3085778 RepID=UPI00397DFADB